MPFGFTDRSGAKWRPAVIVSGDHYNRETPDLIIASITGTPRAISHPGDHLISNWRAGGLLIPSLAQTKLATVEGSLIGRSLGNMDLDDLEALS